MKNIVEHIGNKVPFEKSLNIIASNGYFQKKQEQYKMSKIAITKELSNSTFKEFGLDNIRERDIHLTDDLINLLRSWGLNKNMHISIAGQPSEEELRQIEDFKNKGWV